MSEYLELVDQPPPERRDAARNREALLRATLELIEEQGLSAVTMDAVAERAGVGKGTLFRRFGNREGLMAAIVDLSERTWQESVISGPPPLGPGAPPMERLLAFGCSRLRQNLRQAALLAAAAYPGAGNTAVFSFTTLHVRMLLAELGVTGDLAYLAAALVAPLELITFQSRGTDQPDEAAICRLHQGWTDLVRRVVDCDQNSVAGPGTGE